MKRIVFMGTPVFSVPILEALINAGDYTVVAVVTQPDRPVGRKRKLTPSPVKEVAVAADIPVYQPEKIGTDEDVATLLAADIDLLVTAAYGQFLPNKLLQAPRYGAINVHASLLPKYRGGAPVHYALWNGDDKTGITIMRMIQAMDAGAILAQETLSITPTDNVAILFEKLSQLGRDLLLETLPAIFDETIKETPQAEALATYSPTIKREEEQIDWHQPALAVHNQIRAMNSWPVAHTFMHAARWKLWQSEVVTDQTTTAEPGTIVKIQKKPAQFWVACGQQTVLALTELQPAGKRKMPINSFINGGSGGLHDGDQFTGK